jgi:periplasmic divalent cation tolerance protein
VGSTEVLMSRDIVIVLTTLPASAQETEAAALVGEAMARVLVEEGLAACVNLLPAMTSVYRWQGRTERATERQLVIKTTLDRVPALQARVAQLHPYEVPEFLVMPVAGGGDAYLDWIRETGE